MRLLFNNLQKGVAAAERHLHSYQIAKEEIIYAWLKAIRRIVHLFLVTNGEPVGKDKLLQYEIPDAYRQHVENFVDGLKRLFLWVNKDLSMAMVLPPSFSCTIRGTCPMACCIRTVPIEMVGPGCSGRLPLVLASASVVWSTTALLWLFW